MIRKYIFIFSLSFIFSQNTGGSLSFMNISPTSNAHSLGNTIASEINNPASLLLNPANAWNSSRLPTRMACRVPMRWPRLPRWLPMPTGSSWKQRRRTKDRGMRSERAGRAIRSGAGGLSFLPTVFGPAFGQFDIPC